MKKETKRFETKEIKKLHTWLRALIQILYFLFLPSVYTAAFAGVKYIFTQIGAGEVIGLTSFVTVLIVLCAYTILFGRFFCGFACAFGSLGDGIHAFYIWCFKKKKKKPVLLSEKVAEKLSYLIVFLLPSQNGQVMEIILLIKISLQAVSATLGNPGQSGI